LKLSDEEIEKLRRSGIQLDAEGRFWHEGVEVTHHGLKAAFYRWLDRNPDGRWVLRLDEKRFVWLEVEDAPFVVRSARWQDARLVGLLSDGRELEIDPATLHERGGRPYVTIDRGFEARLSTAAWNVLTSR
jgi:hypothetical protein